MVNRFLPASGQLSKRRPTGANILVVGATNRAADLDPALVRPGRFDRTITSLSPVEATARKSSTTTSIAKPAPDLDEPTCRDSLAAMTAGYSPVMIEHLFDEALVWALRRGRPPSTGATCSRPR